MRLARCRDYALAKRAVQSSAQARETAVRRCYALSTALLLAVMPLFSCPYVRCFGPCRNLEKSTIAEG
jgi:hypothetical protein